MPAFSSLPVVASINDPIFIQCFLLVVIEMAFVWCGHWQLNRYEAEVNICATFSFLSDTP